MYKNIVDIFLVGDELMFWMVVGSVVYFVVIFAVIYTCRFRLNKDSYF